MKLFGRKKETDEEKFQKYYDSGVAERKLFWDKNPYSKRYFWSMNWISIFAATHELIKARDLISPLSHDSLLPSTGVKLTPEDKLYLYLEIALCYLELGKAEIKKGDNINDLINDKNRKRIWMLLNLESSVTSNTYPDYNSIKEKFFFIGLYHIESGLKQANLPTAKALFCKASILEAMYDMDFHISDLEQIKISLNENHFQTMTFSNIEPIDCFESALEIQPDNLEIMFALSLALKKRGRTEDCKNYQDRILEIKPNGRYGKLVKGSRRGHISLDEDCWCGENHDRNRVLGIE
jgi:tetratricopeptide (TPR) repeat protein